MQISLHILVSSRSQCSRVRVPDSLLVAEITIQHVVQRPENRPRHVRLTSS